MYITYCVLVLGYTCVNIPYGTLCGTLTQNIEERAKINTSRSVCAMIAINIINIITLPLISAFGGDNAARGYLLVTVLYGGIFTLCHWFCFAKTKEVVQPPEREKVSLKKQLDAALQNKPYLIALAGQFLFGVTLYGRNADLLYYFKYVEGNENLFTIYSMILIVPSILGAAAFPFVFEKLRMSPCKRTRTSLQWRCLNPLPLDLLTRPKQPSTNLLFTGWRKSPSFWRFLPVRRTTCATPRRISGCCASAPASG